MPDRYTIGSSFGASKKASRKAGNHHPGFGQEKPQRGTVIAVGEGRVKGNGTRVPLDVKAGDLILFGKYTSLEVKLDGQEYLIMRENEVLAIIGGASTKQ